MERRVSSAILHFLDISLANQCGNVLSNKADFRQQRKEGRPFKGIFCFSPGKERSMQVRQKRWMKAIVVAFAFITVGWQASAADEKPTAAKSSPSGGGDKVAMVNGTPITQGDFDRALGFAKQQFSKMGKVTDDAQMKEGVLDQLIGSELLYQESKKTGVRIDAKTVDERLDQWKKRFPNDEEYKKALQAMNLSEDQMKSDIEKGLAIENLVVEKFVDKITVSEKEIKDYYDGHTDMFKQPEQVQASHILIKFGPDAKESEEAEALKKIKDIQEKQKKGEDFAELAKAYSQCPSSAKGGDLGYFGRGQMAPPFEEAAFGMKPGEVSDVVKTQFGYHLIKVVDKKPESTIPFDEIKERLGQYLKQEKVQKEVKEFVDKLRKEAKVETFLKNGS
jgi:peptidyl-prolyl cis-trans isomerase C